MFVAAIGVDCDNNMSGSEPQPPKTNGWRTQSSGFFSIFFSKVYVANFANVTIM